MEFSFGSHDEFDETMSKRKPGEFDSVTQPTFDEVVGSWQPLGSSLESFAVDAETEAILLRSRWQAEVRVRVPAYVLDAERIAEDLRACLTGRDPIVAADNGSIWALFLVANAGDATRDLVEGFTSGLVRELGATDASVDICTVARFETTDIDHLLDDTTKENRSEG